jgi:hypothetical protein
VWSLIWFLCNTLITEIPDQVNAMPHEMCPVCMHEFKKGKLSRPDNALRCENMHFVCMGCIGKLTEPVLICSETCSGLHYKCPMCRVDRCLSPMDILFTMKGSIVKTNQSNHFSKHPASAWNRQRGRTNNEVNH